MAESREYISREEELGSVNISEEVLAAIAGAAALDVEGVGALGSGLGSDVATGRCSRRVCGSLWRRTGCLWTSP